MTTPIAVRAAAPAPLASISGTAPATVAIEVIRIGRRRRRAASRIAVADVAPGVAQLVGELDDQDAVLGGEADQHDQADLAVEVHRLAHHASPISPPATASGTVVMITPGMDEAFELRGEQQIDDEDGEQEDEVDRSARLAERLALAAIADRDHFGRAGRLPASRKVSASPSE